MIDIVFITGIGMLLGVWAVQQGHKETILVGRSGLFGATIPELLSSDACVTAVRCDIGTQEEVESLFNYTSTGSYRLGALFHAGGVLQDAAFLKQSSASVRAVLAPKASFMEHTLGAIPPQPVMHTNLFSSVSAFLGSPGQANYAAANMLLNAYAEGMQHSGLIGSCVQWGAWVDVGMAHQNAAVLARVEKSGLGVIKPTQGLNALEQVLAGSQTGTLTQVRDCIQITVTAKEC